MEISKLDMQAPLQEQATLLPTDPQTSAEDKNSLRIAGALNAIGDIGLLADGFKSKSVPFKLAGWFYTAGAGVAMLFGTASKQHQVQDLTERAAEFVQARNEDKNADVESARILSHRNSGIFASTARALRRYSGQIMLGFYTLGAGAMLTHGIEGYKADKAAGKNLIEARGTIAYGIASLTVKALSFLVTERAEEPKISPEAPKGIVGWLQEKPMRIFGYGSLVTDSLMGLRTYGKYKKSKDMPVDPGTPRPTGWKAFKNGYGWSALTTGSYLLSDVIITSANKDAANAVGKLHNGEQEKIENMMAETIARQPEEKQEKISNEAADFLQKECMVCPTENLRESLLSKVKLLSQKPPANWAESEHVTEKPAMVRA